MRSSVEGAITMMVLGNLSGELTILPTRKDFLMSVLTLHNYRNQPSCILSQLVVFYYLWNSEMRYSHFCTIFLCTCSLVFLLSPLIFKMHDSNLVSLLTLHRPLTSCSLDSTDSWTAQASAVLASALLRLQTTLLPCRLKVHRIIYRLYFINLWV